MSGIDNGWLEAAIAWEVCASLHRQYCKGKDDLFTTRQSDFVKHAENAREHISHGQAPAVAEAILFEHEDGRYAVNPDTTGDPAWHRLGPVDVSAIRSQQLAPSAAPAEQQMVAYLDIGAGGYIDLGSELPDEALLRLPKGRHALIIAGTYGIDGYIAAHTTQPSPAMQGDALDAARYRWLREGNDAKHGAAWHVAVNLYGCEWDAAIDAAIAAQGEKT